MGSSSDSAELAKPKACLLQHTRPLDDRRPTKNVGRVTARTVMSLVSDSLAWTTVRGHRTLADSEQFVVPADGAQTHVTDVDVGKLHGHGPRYEGGRQDASRRSGSLRLEPAAPSTGRPGSGELRGPVVSYPRN